MLRRISCYMAVPIMSLQLLLLGIVTMPAGAQTTKAAVPTTWTASSQSGAFVVIVGPRESRVPVGQFHEWTVTVRRSDGTPVEQARIAIGGGMPGHGHGMPTRPQVTRHLGRGVYLIEGMKFNMAGEWILMFDIESPAQRDRVKFDIAVEH